MSEQAIEKRAQFLECHLGLDSRLLGAVFRKEPQLVTGALC